MASQSYRERLKAQRAKDKNPAPLIEALPQSAPRPSQSRLDPLECPQFAGGRRELTPCL